MAKKSLKLETIKVIPGIYFLLYKNKVVYVGSSTNIYSRIGQHTASQKIFDEVKYMELSENINETEANYIFRLTPMYNKSLPSNKRFINLKSIENIAILNGNKFRVKMIGGVAYFDIKSIPGLTVENKNSVLKLIKN